MENVNHPADYSREKASDGRPRRRAPAQTRERLIAAAAKIFNRDGYRGTDSNRIAKEAGYATGTFYIHFKDKREAFLAVYQAWVTSEWKAIDEELSAGNDPEVTARKLVQLSIDFHTKWRGFRASLIELVFTDAKVRRFYRAQRRRQLDVIAQLRQRFPIRGGRREDDAILLYTTERVYDAIAQGELRVLGLDRDIVVKEMIDRVLALLK